MSQKTLSQTDRHPWLRVIVGRCGSGKSTIAKEIMKDWRKANGGKIFAVDPVATEPPGELHVAESADYWSFEMVEQLPDGTTLVVVDEADLFCAQADAYRRPLPALHALIRRRRHQGVSLLLLTQRSALISRSAWSLSDEIIVLSTTDPRDLKEIEKLPGVTKDDIAKVAAMSEPGIAIVWTPREVTR